MLNFIRSRKEFVVGLILTLSLLWPLATAPFFSHHDDVQVIRLHQMDKCIKDGQMPCRWVPDLGGEYGYPLFNYYAPLPYYVGEIFYLMSGSLIFSVKMMFAVSFVGAYVFMYFLARKFWGPFGGALSAIFYSFAPYHAVDFYVRGAMGEMWALMAFPALLWSFIRLGEKTCIVNLTVSSLLTAFLITSHNLSAMLFLPIILVWIFILTLKVKTRKFFLYSILAILLGVCISAFYLIPMIFEKNLVHVETTTYGYFSYTEHFKGFRKLLFDRFWGWGSSIREVPGGERDGLSFQIGWVHLLAWVIAIYAAVKFWRLKQWFAVAIIFSSIFIAFSAYMINPRSEFIWRLIEPLKFLQFPWRFLMIIIFFISFISGSVILVLKNKKIIIALIVLVVALNFLYFRPEKFINVTEKELLSGERWDRQIKRSIFDYLPVFAKEPPAELAGERYQILTGETKITDFEEGTNWLKFKAETTSHTIIRLSQYYFPDWRIKVDGNEVPIEYKDNTLGLMTIILGQGNHQIEGRLHDTPVRIVSNFITIATLLIMALVFMFQIKRIKKWIRYYRKRID